MRISVTSDNRTFNIRIPTGLAFTGLGMGVKLLKNCNFGIPQNIGFRNSRRLYKIVKNMRKIHKNWILADIESSDGEKVKIKL